MTRLNIQGAKILYSVHFRKNPKMIQILVWVGREINEINEFLKSM